MRFWLLIAAIVLACPIAQAQNALRCPETISENNKKLELNYAGIYDGALGHGSEVMPEEAEWDLQAIRSPGRKFYLECRYEEGTVKDFTLSDAIDDCTSSGDNILCH